VNGGGSPGTDSKAVVGSNRWASEVAHRRNRVGAPGRSFVSDL